MCAVGRMHAESEGWQCMQPVIARIGVAHMRGDFWVASSAAKAMMPAAPSSAVAEPVSRMLSISPENVFSASASKLYSSCIAGPQVDAVEVYM